MAAIDSTLLQKCMANAPMTTKQLSIKVDKSLTYTSDIVLGRRTLKRNPELRKAIAVALGVPQFWIERQDSVPPEAA